MRWLAVVVLLGACGGKPSPPAGGVSVVLDIPNGVLDPKGFTTVEVVLHEPSGDIVRSAKVSADGTFDLGEVDPSPMVSVEATLRNDSGAALGYGRSSADAAFAGGSQIVVPVRRPIAYFAGTVSRDKDGDPNTPGDHWTEAPATFSDLSTGTPLDGTAKVGAQVVMMVSAGPSLYVVTQMTSDPLGALTGTASVAPVSTADHTVGAALAGSLTGGVTDGAGTDDGGTLVIGTTTALFAVNTTTGEITSLASGSFSHVAILTTDTGEIDAVAINNRGVTTGPCATTAELWWATLSGGTPGAHKVATGGFADVAADRGRAYYVDACSGVLGEVTPAQAKMLQQVTPAGAGEPTALAISNGQAFIGVENQPATTSLLVASVATTGAPRTLWNETAQQVVKAVGLDGVQRQLNASLVVFDHLEVGAGGDYVALTTSAHFHGDEVSQANFPDITMDTEELRVFDAGTGGVVQRYRSWCEGVTQAIFDPNDIPQWACASTTGQTAPAPMSNLDHHINSMTFLFGKK